MSGVQCSSSGIGFEQLVDYMARALTWLVSGGSNSFGIFEIFANFGALVYNIGAFYDIVHITDPIIRQVIDDQYIPFVSLIYKFDKDNNDVHLHELRYDAKGI